MNIFAPLIERARETPDALFCAFYKRGKQERITVRQAVDRAADYAERLQATGLKRGDIVLIVLPHTADLYFSFIGCVMAGVIPSFMPPLTRKQDPVVFARSMSALFERIAPAAAIVNPETVALLEGTDTPTILPDDVPSGGVDRTKRDSVFEAASTDTVAFLQHSSGTTGLKKGVMLSHHAVHKQAAAYSKAIGLRPGDVVASWLPLYHDMGLFTSFIIPAIMGAPIVSIDAMEWVMRPTMLLESIGHHKAAFAWLPNFAFHHIMRLDSGQERWDFASLKALISCSEPCRAFAFDTFLDRYHADGLRPDQLGVSYALAENSFAVTQTSPGGRVRQGRGESVTGFLSCGIPIDGVSVEVRPYSGQTVGDAGEIWIKSPYLFDGYFKQPELTGQKLIDGWYKTGDIGLVEDDNLFVIGRVDDLLIVNGRNLFAHELEDAVAHVEGVAPGRVLAYAPYDGETGATELILLVETLNDSSADELPPILRRTIFSFCGIHPKEIHILPRGFLLKSTSGKIARAASISKFSSRNTNGVARSGLETHPVDHGSNP